MAAQIYRKLSVCMYGDEKFRRLSPQKPSAQGLFIYLITGPESCHVPGCINAGKAALAEGLGWPVATLAACFSEIEREGMAIADWGARFVWLPNAVKHNEPSNGNIVKGWIKTLQAMPESPLKNRAVSAIYADLLAIDEAKSAEKDTHRSLAVLFRDYAETVSGTVSKPFAKPFAKPLPEPFRTQEQEQKQKQNQEQKQDQDLSAPSATPSTPTSPPVISIPLVDKTEYGIDAEQIAEWSESYPAVDVLQELRKAKEWAISNPTKKKTRQGIRRHITGVWLSRAQDRGGGAAPVHTRPANVGYHPGSPASEFVTGKVKL
jgi:hypothetical protein